MFCPKCGTENPENAQLCCSCSWVLTSTSTVPGPGAKTSGLAIASLVLAILSPFTCIVTAIPAIILGIVALVKIERSAGQLKGKGLAVAGIAVPVAVLPIIALLMGILMPALGQARELARRVVCGSNMQQVAGGLILYAQDNNGNFPPPDKWCDLLEPYVGSDKKVFACPSCSPGQCNYALNPNAKPSSPPDTVLLFESVPGWNQVGGPELLTTESHQGKGCNIAFVDGHVEFVKPERLKDLKWTAERTSEVLY